MAKTILLIDDDKNTMSYVVDVLENTGEFRVVWLKTVGEVLERVNEIKFDLVILDIMMFWGDTYTSKQTAAGFRTGMRLFQDVLLAKGIPIVVLTALRGRNNREVREAFKEHSQVKRFLNKPFSAVDLRQLIGEILQKE